MHKETPLILVHGLPLCGKSTLAYALACELQMGLVATGFFGRPVYDETHRALTVSRNSRYKACASMAKAYIDAGFGVIVEGNFSSREWREPILEMAKRSGCVFISVYCWCSDEGVLDQRAHIRARGRFEMDRDATPDAYRREHLDAETLVPLELAGIPQPTMLTIDTGAWQLEVESLRASLSIDIVEVLEHWLTTQRNS